MKTKKLIAYSKYHANILLVGGIKPPKAQNIPSSNQLSLQIFSIKAPTRKEHIRCSLQLATHISIPPHKSLKSSSSHDA